MDAAELRKRAAARLQALQAAGAAPKVPQARPTPPMAVGPPATHRETPGPTATRVLPGRPPTFFIEGAETHAREHVEGEPQIEPPLGATAAGGRSSAAPGPHSWAWHSPRHNEESRAASKASASGEGGGATSSSANGILSVHYPQGEHPLLELPRLDGGQGALVTVGAVEPTSRAYRAGVRPGYALVSMDGRTEFTRLPGWQVRMLLEAPITLCFEAPRSACSLRQPGAAATESGLFAPRAVPPVLDADSSVGSRGPCKPPNKDDFSRLRPEVTSNAAEGGSIGGGRRGVWVVAEEVVFKPAGVHDDLLAANNGAPSRSNAPVNCWQPNVGSGLITAVASGNAIEGATGPGLRSCTLVRDHVKPSPPVPPVADTDVEVLCRGRGHPGSPPVQRSRFKQRSPLRWLSPVLGTFVGESCTEDGGNVIDFVEDGQVRSQKAGDNYAPWVLSATKAASPGKSPSRPEGHVAPQAGDNPNPPKIRGDTDQVNVDADPMIELRANGLNRSNGIKEHPSLSGYVSQNGTER